MIDELGRELAAVGIRGRLRARILTETDAHIRSDPEAAARFGEPREIANAFAAELGTYGSRRAATRAFVALGIAGAVYAAAFIGASVTSNPSVDTASASLALMVVIVAPQVSFVAGSLALLRSLRLRRSPVLSTAELTTINRRTIVALVSGLGVPARGDSRGGSHSPSRSSSGSRLRSRVTRSTVSCSVCTRRSRASAASPYSESTWRFAAKRPRALSAPFVLDLRPRASHTRLDHDRGQQEQVHDNAHRGRGRAALAAVGATPRGNEGRVPQWPHA